MATTLDGREVIVCVDKNGRSADVNTSNELQVVASGIVCGGNSTDGTLDADGTFVGVPVETLDYSMIVVSTYSDQASATDGLSVQFSTDGTNWDHRDVYTVPAATGKTYSFQTAGRWFRTVYYNNDGTAQSEFRLQSLCKKSYTKPSSHRIQDPIIDEDDAELVKSVLTAKANGGGFTNVTATASNNLRVTDAENGLAIAKGDVTETTFIHKFGNAPDFDATDGTVTIWDGANDGDIDQMRYVYSSSADIDTISSSSESDTFDLEIQGLDGSYDLVTQTKALNGQTKVTLDTPLQRVFRMKNDNSSDNVGYIYCYVDGTVSSGVPDDSTSVRAIIGPGNNQTLMAVYTVPDGKTGYMRDWYASVAGASKDSNYLIEVRARPFGKVFQLKHRSSLSDNGTSNIHHKYEEPEVFSAKTDIELRTSAVASGVTAAQISGGFDIVLVDD
jgi:hypothetical protein